MSLDRSLKAANSLVRHRNVLTRAERLARLVDEERWDESKGIFGLPKVANRKLETGGKSNKAEEAAEGTAAAGGAAAPAEGAAGAAGTKGAAPKGGAAPAKGATPAAAGATGGKGKK